MSIKICTFNVNGIRQISKKGLLQDFVNTEKPDILCLQEVKASSIELLPQLDGYQIASDNLGLRKGYSGVLTLKRKDAKIKINPSQVHFELLPEEANGEGRVCMITVNNWCIINVYTPNSGADNLNRLDYRVNVWDVKFLEFLQACIKTFKKKVIVCGDLNVARMEKDLARPSSNKNSAGYTERERSSFENLLFKSNITDVFRYLKGPDAVQYTYWSYMRKSRENNVGWRIDYFLIPSEVKDSIKTYESFKDALGSDHCPVMITATI